MHVPAPIEERDGKPRSSTVAGIWVQVVTSVAIAITTRAVLSPTLSGRSRQRGHLHGRTRSVSRSYHVHKRPADSLQDSVQRRRISSRTK